MKRPSLSQYVNDLQRHARYSFTRSQAGETLEIRGASLTKALQRLVKVGRIYPIRRGFYVIVPLEYSAGGIIPVDWFIDSFMRFLRVPYYVGLLSAAAIHGAAHQQPQEFQVVVPRFVRPVVSAKVRIVFFRYLATRKVGVKSVKTYTGYIPVSTPAATALDLVRYSVQIGGLDSVVTVLEELAEKISPADLLSAAKKEKERSQVQRLGWLLDSLGKKSLSDPLAHWLAAAKPSKIPLDASHTSSGYRKDPRFQVIVNAQPLVES